MDPLAAVEAAHRDHWARLLALLAGRLGGLDLAEDCLAEAYAAAVATWPAGGVPANPPGWLRTVAWNRAMDRLRRDATLTRTLPRLAADETAPPPPEPHELPDDRLRLIFTCAHPALSPQARIALTLRCVAGLPTDRIAALFLTPVPTMAARITRAKKKITAARIPYRVPEGAELAERLGGVLATVYLVFTAGQTDEALRLARLLAALMPDEPEALGLLALLLLTEARDYPDRPLLLADHDRTRWNTAMIAEGLDALARATARGGRGRRVLEAAIAAEHARTATPDWPRIAALYRNLERITGSPVVRLNRAVAVAEAEGPDAGLALLDGVELPGYHLLPAVRADLLRRLGRHEEARAENRTALALAPTEAERALLRQRIAAGR